MKKIFTLFVSSLFSLSLLAFDGSHLSISKVNNNMKLKIEVDGQGVMMQGNSITLTNLSEGNHNVRVYREKKFDYVTNRVTRGYEIIYATSVYLGRAYQVDITIDGFGKVFMDSYRIAADSDCNTSDNDGYGYNGSLATPNDVSLNNAYTNVMSAREFGQVKEQIGKEWVEANKLISVKTIIAKNNFTTQQVYDLMLLFSFESNRLDIAKYAYCNTVDKQNFYQLIDALSFSSNKSELADFIHDSK
jgi:hypothetical protein